MYYLLQSNSRPRRRVGASPFVEGLNWWRGAAISVDVPNPLRFELDPYQPASPDEDQYMGAFIYTNPPLWRDDFVEALKDCGVCNFEAYPVEIINPSNAETLRELRDLGVTCFDDSYLDRGGIYTNYKAINILGLLSAADMQRSKAVIHGGAPMIDVDFDELVIDESRARGAKMGRLAEATNAILVHESLRDALLERGFAADLAFYDLKEAAI